MADSEDNRNLPTIFEGFDFEGHHVRVIKVGHDVFFVATDVAKALGYSNTRKAISDHCKNAISLEEALKSKGERFVTPTEGCDIQGHTIIIPLSDVLRLFVRSQMPAAARLEKKVFEEILPAIYKTGSYTEQGVTPNIQGSDIPTLLEAAAKELREREVEADKLVDVIADEQKRRKTLAIESAKSTIENRRLKEALAKMEKEAGALSGHASKFRTRMNVFMKALREGKLNVSDDLLDQLGQDQEPDEGNITPIRPRKS